MVLNCSHLIRVDFVLNILERKDLKHCDYLKVFMVVHCFILLVKAVNVTKILNLQVIDTLYFYTIRFYLL